MLSDEYLKKLAQFDEHMQIKSIQETYLDYYVINSNLYHLGLESTIHLSLIDEKMWDRYEYFTFNRITEGIISVCMSNRIFPVIKCIRNSSICKRIANSVSEFMQQNIEFVRRECSKDHNGMLFIHDRKEDPVTPLLNQWSYQAMLHELLGINNNITEIKHSDNKIDKYPLNDIDDKFFISNLDSEFDQVAEEIQKLVDKMSREQAENKVESIEELKKFVQNLPQKKKESAEFTKHTYLFYEVSEIMQRRKLLELSTLEQDIACNDNKKDQYNKITAIIKSSNYGNLDKAKLFLLYCFRYEDDGSVSNLKACMQDNNLGEWTEYSDLLISYAGKNKRLLDVLSNKDFLAKSKNKFFSAFGMKNDNVFFQHVSYLNSILEKLIKNKMKDNEVDTVFRYSDRER